jgi:DTW domain-containing protein YfiP
MTAKRPYCQTCCRPCTTCVCALAVCVMTATEVIVWQHPSERDHPKGSACLLNLCLPNSRLVVREQCSPEGLGVDRGRCALLYPDVPGAASLADPGTVDQLLLLDGTWRKSRKMLHLNPWLAELPRLALAPQCSVYSIRKAQAPYQLSTFEAAVSALQILEPCAPVAPLEGVFTRFVDHIAQYRPGAKPPN